MQLLILCGPLFITGVKGLGQTAPAHIAYQNFLIIRTDPVSGHVHLTLLQILEQANSGNIVCKLGLCAAVAEPVVRVYMVIFRLVSIPAFCKISQSLIPCWLASQAESLFSAFASLVAC